MIDEKLQIKELEKIRQDLVLSIKIYNTIKSALNGFFPFVDKQENPKGLLIPLNFETKLQYRVDDKEEDLLKIQLRILELENEELKKRIKEK